MTFYPLVFAGFYSVVFDNGKKRFWLIIGMTLLAYTHLLSLLLVTAVLGLLFLFCLVKKKITYQNMLTLVLSAVVMLCLSAASLGPLLLEMISFQIRSVHSYNLQDRAYSFSTALSDSLKNWIDYKSIGIFVLVVLGAGIISYFTKYAGFINKNPVLRLSLGLTAFFSMAMTTVFPWHLFQNTPVRIMQFPFRLMSFLMLFASFFAAVVTAKWLTIKKRRTWIGMVLMGLGIIMLTMFTLTRFISDQVRGPLLYSATEIEQTKRYQTSVNKDYFPKGLTKTQSISIVEKKGDVNGEKQAMPYSFSGPNAVFHLVLKEQENKIDLPIIAYIGMEVTDEQEKRIEYKDSSRKTVQIELPEGEHRINVHFVPTLFMKFCMFLSAGTAAVLSIVYIADRKRKK